MHDDDKLKLARECSAKVSEEQGYHGTATATRNGKRDDFDSVQSALAAINALDPQLVEAVGLLREISEQSDTIAQCLADRDMTESEHAWCKLFAAFRNKADAFLAKQGDA